MKKWYGGGLIASLFMLLVLRYVFMKNPIRDSYLTSPFSSNSTNPLEWINAGVLPVVQNPENASQVISADSIVSSLFGLRNISDEEQQSLHTWDHLKYLINHAQVLPNALEAIKEAGIAWTSLLASVEEEKLGYTNESSVKRAKEKQCPYFLNKMNATELGSNGYKLGVPCGLTQGSSITIIGIPDGLLGNFRIDLTGEPLPGEPDPPVILHYNVRLHGDKITEDPVIVQNTWTIAHDWGEEERCPSPAPDKNKKVDELDQCNEIVGKDDKRVLMANYYSNGSRRLPMVQEASKTRKYFPFKQGYHFVSTLRVGSEGIQMTVDGKHITSFAYREHKNKMVNEELWNEARTYGDTQLMPFVDYYSIITWKALAICIFGTEVVSAKFVMKTDDDAFVRVDEVLASLNRINVSHGLLYGLINSDSRPHRNTESKWYISPEEWPEETYPPWAHGPGYVVSHDIAKQVYKRYKKGRLKMFKLEDVAMGIWIADMKKGGMEVWYEKEERVYNEGCKDGYVVAHYQAPREMLCLWQKLQEKKRAQCCGEP
ncbi:beta-1,3-galactosyltransferase GALT1 isoform X2 [Vitis riparia]|uniref:beta-1,3-galactosyltransferase GALT1 isoform X2 n=1 Tax=Vitis riparia TaxID=96939 RepID=UPI00155A2D0F|nr:beta-1,3-galactosyltransferase GALT1 isoform X2 [Vitis riparia]